MGASASLKKGNTSDDESDDDISAPEGDDTAGSSPAPHTSFFKIKKKEKHGTFFTSEELQEIKEMEEMQKKVTSFISKHFFYAVPVSIVRQSVDPYSPVFVQPNANLALERVHAQQMDTVQKDWTVVKSVPTTVMVTSKGNVLICFEKTGSKYELNIHNLLENIEKNTDTIVEPNPPALTSRTQSSLLLSWDDLPDPPGLSQYVEVQYSRILRHKNKKFFNALDSDMTLNHAGVHECDLTAIKEEAWLALVSKTWDSPSFTRFTFTDLTPGSSYLFRLRYRNHRGWSEFSPPSRVFRTEPGVPCSPSPPLSNAIMPHAVHLRWSPPADNNGAVVVRYILEGRAVGDEFSVLFSGMRLSFVVFNLYPQAGYNFQVSAVNAIGASTPSTVYSILTPALLHTPPYKQDWRQGSDFMTDYLNVEQESSEYTDSSHSCYANAQRCCDAWVTHYDFQTNQMFYFNVLTGSRQLHMPTALLTSTSPASNFEAEEAKALDDVEVANEKKKAFRTKRFRFIRDVHVDRKQKYKEVLTHLERKQNGAISLEHDLPPASNPFTLPIIRQSLLSDTYKAFSLPNQSIKSSGGAVKIGHVYKSKEQGELFGKLSRKLRILFHEEAGIDVGGLSKEFYLLLSEQMVAYMNKNCRGIIRWTESGKMFFDEEFCEETEITSLDVESNSPHAESGENGLAAGGLKKKVSVSSESLLEMIEMHVRGDEFCQFFGRLLGKAIYDQRMLSMPLCGVLLAHLVGCGTDGDSDEKDVEVRGKEETRAAHTTMKDMSFLLEELLDLDPALFKSLQWMENNCIENVIDNTFTVLSKANKSKTEREINLCKNGDRIDVTEDNKGEYVRLLKQWKTTFSVNSLLAAFLDGFWEVIPLQIIQSSHITKEELDLIMNGKPVIDVEEIRAYTIYQGEEQYGDNHPAVIQLWQIVRECQEDMKRLFLLFVTGTSRVPLDGYDPAFNITQGVGMQDNSLPRAHTCFNQLVLPQYTSIDAMREKLLFAVKETEGFQLS